MGARTPRRSGEGARAGEDGRSGATLPALPPGAALGLGYPSASVAAPLHVRPRVPLPWPRGQARAEVWSCIPSRPCGQQSHCL